MQNRYYDPTYSEVPLRFLEFDLVGWLMLFGLVYLAVTALRSIVSMALATLVGAAYVWFFVGYIGVLVDIPLLTTKTTALIEVGLLAGAAVGAIELGRATLRAPMLQDRVGSRGSASAWRSVRSSW